MMRSLKEKNSCLKNAINLPLKVFLNGFNNCSLKLKNIQVFIKMETATIIIDFGKKKEFIELQQFIAKTSAKDLTELAVKNVGRSDVNILWNYLLIGCSNIDSCGEKRFQIVMGVLNELNRVELTIKQNKELITRLFIDLPKFTPNQLIELSEYCIESIRGGDAKCVGWKDLLPEIVSKISNIPMITVNGIPMTGAQYRQELIRNLSTMKWAKTILTPLATMFKEMLIHNDEKIQILGKLCENINKQDLHGLPPLSHQLFSLCNNVALIVMPIFSLNKFFHKNNYKKLLSECDSESTYDSLDLYSEKELREIEDTILYHLNKSTEFCIKEKNIVLYLRGLAAAPRYILSPFILSSIIAMCNVNRYPDSSNLSASHILLFLRNVVKNNETEKEMCKQSAWCRVTLDRANIDFEKVQNILIEHSIHGTDVITSGIVGLAFALLKTPNDHNLNLIGIHFLETFIKKRYIFGYGIVKNIAKFLFAEQGALQYSECLLRLSLTNTLTISECTDTIKHILEFFLLIPGHHAMRMMTFITNLAKISNKIRDMLIDILRKAMYQSDRSTRQMGVFGFCLLLKQIKNNNASRATSGVNFSQPSISGYSLMSQRSLGRIDNPQRYFDMLALEVLGILRKCFNQTYEIKEIMYEGLTKAIVFNPKLIPHVIQFIEYHFQSFFEINGRNIEIKFDFIVRERCGEIEVLDQLGKLIYFFGHCVNLCQSHRLPYDTQENEHFFKKLLDGFDDITVEKLGLVGALDQKMSHKGSQYLNCLEALMGYAIWSANENNDHMGTCLKLFKHHKESMELLKAVHNPKKAKKGKKTTVNDTNTSELSKSGTLAHPVVFHVENLWDLRTLERFLRVIHDDAVSFVSASQTNPLRTNREFGRYVLGTTCTKIEGLRSLPDYYQIKFSKITFTQICQITRIIYEKCVKRLLELCERFDILAAEASTECFRQCLLSVDNLFKRKFCEFLREITFEPLNNNIGKNVSKIIGVLQSLIEKFLEQITEEREDTNKIVQLLMQCLEILYDYIPAESNETIDSYNWLYKTCCDYDIQSKNLGIIHKLLFAQYAKTNFGVFFNSIAMQIEQICGQINEEPVKPQFQMKSINIATVESCTLHLCGSLKTNIQNIEYFITKAKSFHVKLKIAGQGSSENCLQTMKNIEKQICSHLIHITNTVIHLSNACLTLGPCMDAFIRLLIQLYICLSNISKHLILRHATVPVLYSGTNFDSLVKTAGRPLASRIYNLITHIEQNIFEGGSRKKNDPKADKAKVLKETKFIPKLIMRIESFNKFVILLSKKTKVDLSHYLHIGTVRDFRIKTSELLDVLNQTIQESNDIDVDESHLDQSEASDFDCEIEQSSITSTDTSIPISLVVSSSTSSDIITDINITDVNKEELVLQNMAKINEKSRKDKSRSLDSIKGTKRHKSVTTVKKKSLGKQAKKKRSNTSRYKYS